MMMDENEKLEQAGHKVTAGENEGRAQQQRQSEQPKGMGGTDLRGEDSAPLVNNQDSEAPYTPAFEEKYDDEPEANDIKKNPDPEPGVPDQDF
ncbi:hypothetical protein QFZ20_002121 [Flavobacterium sp. W4I14]|nr:hypothetical protein [Flavobacterium sp. W4I14]